MRYTILGPIEVISNGRPVPVARPQRRALLALLLLNANRPISPPAAIEALWGPTAPKTAQAQIHSAVHALRAQLRDAGCPGTIDWRAGGYAIRVEPDQLDADRLGRHLAEAKNRIAKRRFAEAADAARAGLALWRGEPLANAQGAFVAATREHLHERRRATLEALAEAELAVGRHAEVIGELAPLMDEYPLHEKFCEQLMRALHRAGRTVEALERFRRLRAALADLHGLDPSPALRDVEGAILRGELEPALQHDEPRASGPGVAGGRRGAPAATGPAQLPPPRYGFSGRGGEGGPLDRLLAGAARHPTAVVISAVSGVAGIGKTALAVHWAHRMAGAFPDGQLYVNLRGFDPDGAAMDPHEALRGFLDALGVPAHRMPIGQTARTGLFRSLLAGRRMLVLLDNARDAAQVRPLLPGAPGCAVLVTSRNQLPSLVASEGAQPLILDVLTAAEARELLTRRLGEDRTAGQLQPLESIIAGCGRLPLALAIVAARAATSTSLPLASLAAELHTGDSRDRLDALTGADRTVDVREVFSWSYHRLGAEAGLLFRLFGLHPGPHLRPNAAASLAGTSAARIRPLLAELTTANLVARHSHDRHVLHDLLRAYATELTHRKESDEERRLALRRLLDHYLHTSRAAALLLNPIRDQIPLDEPEPHTALDDLADDEEALAWLTTERPALIAMIRLAAQTGFHTHAWQLAWTLDDFFDRRGHWADQAASQETALAAARRLAERSAQAQAHSSLGRVYNRLARYDEAEAHLRQALRVFGELGDDVGRARSYHNLSEVAERRGRYDEALISTKAALNLCRANGHRLGQANTLTTIGWYHMLLGRHRYGLAYCRKALPLHQELGDRHGEAACWDSLGYAHHHLGQHEEALACYRRALKMCREFGDRYNEAGVLANLGDAYAVRGDGGNARAAWRQALDILDDLDHPDADQVRQKLATAS
ncbi:tetratricopeptide repeat protein [Micromonospora sp. CPCC 205371]|nr:tetratricopeptide repeat protein [Micromonospora sp. CPCC 205371]